MTIGDTLDSKRISWAWYAGGWNSALEDGRRDPKVKRAVMAAELAFGLPVDVDLNLMRLTAGVAVLLAERDEEDQ